MKRLIVLSAIFLISLTTSFVTASSAQITSAPQSDEVRWKLHPDVLQYKGADWKNEVRRESGITLERAKNIGASDPNITFFFYVKGPQIFLEGKSGPNGWTTKGNFRRGDAVFFTGQPWYGSAPNAADAYGKIVVERTESVNDGCSMRNYVRSFEGKHEISIRFVNNHENQVHLYWINYEREAVFYKTLQNGDSYTQNTFLTHPWLVRDDTGLCLGVFEPVEKFSEAVVL